MTSEEIKSAPPKERASELRAEIQDREEEVRRRLTEIWDTQRERLTAAVAKIVQRRGWEYDPESIMMSAAASCLRGNYEDYDELNVFGLLLTIADRKAVARLRRRMTKKRGEGRVYRDADLTPFRTQDDERYSLVGTPSAPDPASLRESDAFAEEAAEEFEFLLAALLQRIGDATAKKILLLKAEGRSTREIAVKLGVSESTVKRKWSRIQAAAKVIDSSAE